MLTGRAALERPQVNELTVTPVRLLVDGNGIAGSRGVQVRSRVNRLSELERRAARVRRNGTFHRRRA